MPLVTQDEVVAAGVDQFSKAEVKSQQAQKAALDLVPIFEAANGLLMMGAIEAHQMIADAKAAAGLMAQGESLLWQLHRRATDIAIKNGVDIVTPAGGGPR